MVTRDQGHKGKLIMEDSMSWVPISVPIKTGGDPDDDDRNEYEGPSRFRAETSHINSVDPLSAGPSVSTRRVLILGDRPARKNPNKDL